VSYKHFWWLFGSIFLACENSKSFETNCYSEYTYSCLAIDLNEIPEKMNKKYPFCFIIVKILVVQHIFKKKKSNSEFPLNHFNFSPF